MIPLSPAIYFLGTHPWDWAQFVQDAISTPASLTAWLDVMISALTVLVFVYREGVRRRMQRLWVYGLATLAVGPSLGLPLFLYVRSQVVQAEAADPLARAHHD